MALGTLLDRQQQTESVPGDHAALRALDAFLRRPIDPKHVDAEITCMKEALSEMLEPFHWRLKMLCDLPDVAQFDTDKIGSLDVASSFSEANIEVVQSVMDHVVQAVDPIVDLIVLGCGHLRAEDSLMMKDQRRLMQSKASSLLLVAS